MVRTSLHPSHTRLWVSLVLLAFGYGLDAAGGLCWDVRVQKHVTCDFDAPTPKPTIHGQGQSQTDLEAEHLQQAEIERQRREEQEAERQRAEETRKREFFKDNENALNQLKRLSAIKSDTKTDSLPLKSGTSTLGLKTTPNPTLELKGIGPADNNLKSLEVSNGSKDSAPVDLRDQDPQHLAAIDPRMVSGGFGQSQLASLRRSFKMKEIPSPDGYKSKSERETIASALSDEQLTIAIERTNRQLNHLKNDMLRDVDVMQELLEETKQAEHDAKMVSAMLLAGGLINRMPKSVNGLPQYTEVLRNLKFIAGRAHTIVGHVRRMEKAQKQPDYATVELMRSLLLDAYSTLAESQDAIADDAEKWLIKRGKDAPGPGLAILASFAVDYGEAATRWSFAAIRMQSIIDHIDQPRGKLAAQESLGRFYEDLINERNRRMQTKS